MNEDVSRLAFRICFSISSSAARSAGVRPACSRAQDWVAALGKDNRYCTIRYSLHSSSSSSYSLSSCSLSSVSPFSSSSFSPSVEDAQADFSDADICEVDSSEVESEEDDRTYTEYEQKVKTEEWEEWNCDAMITWQQ